MCRRLESHEAQQHCAALQTCRLEFRCTKTGAAAYSGYDTSRSRSAHASVSRTYEMMTATSNNSYPTHNLTQHVAKYHIAPRPHTSSYSRQASSANLLTGTQCQHSMAHQRHLALEDVVAQLRRCEPALLPADMAVHVQHWRTT